MRRKAELILFLTTFFWASAFIVVKESLHYIQPFTFAALRFVFGALFYFPVLLFGKNLRGKWFLSREGFLLGLCLALGFLLQTLSLVYTSASNSAFLTSLFVIFVPLLGFLIFKEKFSKRILWGLLLSVVGLYFLSKPDFAQNSVVGLGDFLSILCALAFAVQIMLISRFTRKGNAVVLAWQQIFWCGFLCAVMALIFESASFPELKINFVMPRVWGGVLYCSLLCTALAFWVQGIYQRHTSDFRATIIYTIEPVLATVMAVALKQEVIGQTKVLAFFILFAGILLALEPNKNQMS